MTQETKHTAEPWKSLRPLSAVTIGGHQHKVWPVVSDDKMMGIAVVILPHEDITKEMQAECKANAERIVTCVNALEGIADPAQFVQSHAELMEALEKVRHWIEDPAGDEETTTEEIIDIIKVAMGKGAQP